VFYADYAAFYCTDADAAAGSARAGWIRIYKYSTQMHQLELVKEERVVAAETSAEYGRYSLVKLGADGFLFKEAGVATLHRFPITSAAGVGITALLGSTAAFARVTTTALVADEALSCTETATVSVAADKAACAAVAGADLATAVKCNSIVTAAAFALSATTPKACTYTYAASGGTLAGAAGTANKKGFIMQQVSEDPASYALANVPAIYGWLNEGGDAGKPPAFFKLRWSNASGGTLTAVDVTMVPVKYAILLKPEHVSFGRNYVAIMSALDCAATAAGSLVGQH
jgi:phage gp45-like